MKYDGINIVEEASEVFIAENSTNNPQEVVENNSAAEKTSNNFDDPSVNHPIVLNMDKNRNFEEKIVNNKAIVTVKIENANLAVALKFRTFLTNIIKNQAKEVIIDLSFVRRIDSTFFGVLVEGLKKTESCGGNLVLVANTSLMLSSFVMINLDMLFTSFSSVNEAMKYLDNGINQAA